MIKKEREKFLTGFIKGWTKPYDTLYMWIIATCVFLISISFSIYLVQNDNIWQQQMREQIWTGQQGTERALTAALMSADKIAIWH